HQSRERVDQIVDVAKRAGLPAIAVDRDVTSKQRLDDKIGHDPTIVWMHARAVSIENSRHLDAQAMLAPIVEKQRFGATLALVIAGTRANRIDVAPVVLGLRMGQRIAIDLRGR